MTSLIAWVKAQASKPLFVTAWTFFAGALGKELTTTLETGHVDLSLKSFESMTVAAVSTTVVALLHLYLQVPNPTVMAAFPPSSTPVQVPATLEPVDPKAVKVQPK